MTRSRSLAALLCAALLASCGEKAVQSITAPAPGARIKFFNFGVNAPGVNFYAGDQKMTAINSTTGVESTTGTVYGGVGNGGLYSGITPGQYALSGRIAAATDKDLSISNFSATLGDGKYYSFYQSDFYNTTAKTVDGFLVEDAFSQEIDFSVAYVRFVHAISNANPLTLYAKNTTTAAEVPVGAEISYKGAGAFTSVTPGGYDLSARYTGTATNALSRPAVSFAGGKVYTITARGDITVAPTTTCVAANRTCLDNTANR